MKRNLIFYIITACLFFCTNVAKGQDLPGLPGEGGDTYSIESGKSLMFGTVTLSDAAGSGSVIVSDTGNRSQTGSVVLLSSDAHEASFYLKIPANRTFLIQMPPQNKIDLEGSNGGTLHLTLGDLSRPKNTSDSYDSNVDGSIMTISFGGSLDIGPIVSNPGGSYSGFIPITFVVQ